MSEYSMPESIFSTNNGKKIFTTTNSAQDLGGKNLFHFAVESKKLPQKKPTKHFANCTDSEKSRGPIRVMQPK